MSGPRTGDVVRHFRLEVPDRQNGKLKGFNIQVSKTAIKWHPHLIQKGNASKQGHIQILFALLFIYFILLFCYTQ